MLKLKIKSKAKLFQQKIRMWNIKTLLRHEKSEELKHEMKLKQLNILGMCEIRWGDHGDF